MTRTYEDSPDDTGTISNDTASSVSEEAAGALSELDPENFQDRGTESPGEALRVRWTDKLHVPFQSPAINY
ncbi:unnamed protein product [Rhizoctonia solani]|uniref:Uncharacterized protein n=1 Tax=Rhizoctonia solani TaxID=456999 RepID=A0A8H3GNN1_9AGAM|nr:unnamed protein product [Rhizoctonia solani]